MRPPWTATLIERERDRARFYTVQLCEDLFGTWTLVREYGCIGRAGNVRMSPYPDREAAEAEAVRLLRQRERSGYRVSSRLHERGLAAA